MNKTLLFLALVIFGIITYFQFYPSKNHSTFFDADIPTGYNSIGLDVSHHQGEMNWDLLFESLPENVNIDFVYLKATEGSDHLDTEWKRNRKELLKKKIPHGAYHFFSTKKFPKPQAEHFLNHYKFEATDLPPVLDVETEGFSDEDLIAKMKIWLKFVEDKTGVKPIIYTSKHFYQTKFKNEFEDYKFWIAAYSGRPSIINRNNIVHWQFTDKARVPGTDEFVDLNVSKEHFFH